MVEHALEFIQSNVKSKHDPYYEYYFPNFGGRACMLENLLNIDFKGQKYQIILYLVLFFLFAGEHTKHFL